MWKEPRIKLSKWDVEAAAAACLDIPLNSAIFPARGKGREKGENPS